MLSLVNRSPYGNALIMTSNGPDDFIRDLGEPFIAHLLRRISDRLVQDAGKYEAEIGIRAPPRTASTLLLLKARGPQSVTAIADALRQSHPLIINWVGELQRLGLVRRSADPSDARRSLVELTTDGGAEAERMASASIQIGEAYRKLLAEADAPIHEPLWRVHDLLVQGRLAELLRANLGAAR